MWLIINTRNSFFLRMTMQNTNFENNIGWLKLEHDQRDEELGEFSDAESESLILGLPSFTVLVHTILAIILYLVAGPALIFLNKHILVTFNFPYPVFVSSLGLWASVFISRYLFFCMMQTTLQKKKCCFQQKHFFFFSYF